MVEFFLSYNRRDDGERRRYVEEFFERLCDELARVNPDWAPQTVWYRDLNQPIGTKWALSLSEALATCRVFVPLLSPNYFSPRSYCGKEWWIFEQRQRAFEESNGLTNTRLIVPVVWERLSENEMRRPGLSAVQWNEKDFPTEYWKKGLRRIVGLGDKRQTCRGI